MEASSSLSARPNAFLQLLLFVDKRPSSSERIRQIRDYLKQKQDAYPHELQVIDVGEQPYLAEHFRLVATPAIIKTYPAPQQTLAGSNLVEQLENWWMRWQQSIDDQVHCNQADGNGSTPSGGKASNMTPIAHAAELIQLSDDLFRLKQEKADLEAQLQFKDRLIAMLAHDLRNPLTALSIALETLEMGNVPDGVESRLKPSLRAQLLRHARTQTKAIDRMITDILQAARGSDVRLQIHPTNLDLKDLFSDILHRLQNQFDNKFQRVKTDIPSDLPTVYADPELVKQLIINLLDNATKYTPENGLIEVVALHRTTQKVQVSICDDGPGIPKENQEKIFEDRFRLKRDEAKEGYGIGLSLCQRIVRAHYGQIWVDSSPGEGSSFHFTLPVFRS
ncbi:MAG: histidine kinase [Synechococcales bacterium]|nr:histidine kinase [Synechococcales bacterium]